MLGMLSPSTQYPDGDAVRVFCWWRWPFLVAVPWAHWPVETRPRSSARIPQPPRTAQAAWLELTNWGPVLVTMEPVTATPTATPNWRPVEAMAPATPGWSGGSPETAVLVMGGATRPAPAPNTA
jgi:hypothetical protein